MNEGIGGMSQKNFLMAVDNDEDAAKNQKIDDKYSKPIPPSEDRESDKRDAVTKKRESFLNIYKEEQD